MAYGLKKYRQHLLGRKIFVRTDHAALTFLKKTPEPICHQGRWLDLLSEYNIEIKHRPGRVHSNSDALSRRPCKRNEGKDCEQCQRTIAGSRAAQANGVGTPTTGQVQPPDNPRPLQSNSFWEGSYDLPQWFETDTPKADLSESSSLPSPPTSSNSTNQVATTPEPPSITLNDICTAQAEDDNLIPVIQALLDQNQPAHDDLRQYPEEARVLLAQWDSLVLQDGTVYRKFHFPDGTLNLQIVLPAKLRRPFIERLHAELRHFGRTKTCYAVSH